MSKNKALGKEKSKAKKGFVEKPLVVKVLTTQAASIKTLRTQIMSGESDSLPVILAFGR